MRIAGIALLLLLLFPGTDALADYEFITRAQVSLAQGDTPPQHATDWRAIELPRSWSIDPLHPKDTRQAWYRIPLPEPVRSGQWRYILILRHMLNVELWLDDQFVGSGGPVSQPPEAHLQRNWNRPVLWELPEQTNPQSPPHYLYVRLLSEPAYGVMTPVIMGDADSLIPWYRISHFVQISLVEISIMAMMFTALLSLFVWRKTGLWRWLLLTTMSVAWSLPLLFIVLPTLPLPEFLALRLIHWGVVAGASALLVFIHDFYLNTPRSQLQGFALIPVLHAIVLGMVPDTSVVMVGNIGQLVCQFLFVLLIIQLLRSPQRHHPAVRAVIAGLIVMLAAALHDVTLFSGSNTARWRWDTPLSYITQPVMLLILAWQGVKVFLDAARNLADANRGLERRLLASEERIKQVYAEQETLERQLRLERERELVYRDLHDDLGARLLSLVYQSEPGRTQDLARTALQDLRDIVSRVLAQDQGLGAVLADCMAEQMGRAERLGITLDWELDPRLDSLICDSRLTLGLRLLMRELTGACLHTLTVERMDIQLSWQADDNALSLETRLSASLDAEALGAILALPVLQKRLQTLHALATVTALGVRVQIPLPATGETAGSGV